MAIVVIGLNHRTAPLDVLERVTLADLAAGRLPARVEKLASTPDAQHRR